MNLIFAIEPGSYYPVEEFRKRGCAIELIPLHRLVHEIRDGKNREMLADAIVCFTESDFAVDRELPPVSVVSAVEKDLRSIPDDVAMPDGRKWKSVPFLMLVSELVLPGDVYFDRYQRKVLRYENIDHAFTLVDEGVRAYRQRLLDDLDNLGFLVKVENGRYRVGPALKPRPNLESELYYGRSDQRGGGDRHYVTIDRDLCGVQYEIELFEALINKADVSEGDLQRFFEANPHFLAIAQIAQALPHVRLEAEGGRLLIPDFVLKPIIPKRDSNWRVLDLKTPQVKLLTGTAERAQFSQQVMKAITQLQDYGEYFKDSRNSEKIARMLGHPLKHPKLAVLIGRLQKDRVEELETAQSRQPHVEIVTYDDILEAQKHMFESRRK